MVSNPFGEESKGNPFIPGSGPECVMCPFCLMLYGVRHTRPEVMDHLQKAAFELLMAGKAFLEQAAEKVGPDEALHRIPVR